AYPLADDGLISINYSNFHFGLLGVPFARELLLLEIETRSRLSDGSYTERSVGIVPQDWLRDNLGLNDGTFGYSYRPQQIFYPTGAVVIEDYNYTLPFLAAHEIGHTYGLCDEYNSAKWQDQNKLRCPNGDIDNNYILDPTCGNDHGCNVSTFSKLV